MSRERSGERHEAAYSATGRRKAPLAWLPWAALALLLLLAGLAFLVARNAGDDSDEAGLDVVDDAAAGDDDSVGLDGQDAGEGSEDADGDGIVDDAATAREDSSSGPGTGSGQDSGAAASATPATASAANAVPVTTGPAAGSGGTAVPASGAAAAPLTAGGQAILPLPAGGLASLAGQPAVGTGVTVESVVADEGFWVGTSPTDRVFVLLTPQARTTEGESPFQVEAGQRVELQGTLIALPGEPATFGVDAAEGADQLIQQGHLIEATSIALS